MAVRDLPEKPARHQMDGLVTTGQQANVTSVDDGGHAPLLDGTEMAATPPQVLQPGESPFDALSRSKRLLRCLESYSALASLFEVVLADELLSAHPKNKRALEKAQLALGVVEGEHGRPTIRRQFFQFADVLLFGDFAAGRNGWPLVCEVCGAKMSFGPGEQNLSGLTHKAGNDPAVSAFCHGPLRRVRWSDLRSGDGPADQIFCSAPVGVPEVEEFVQAQRTVLHVGQTPFDLMPDHWLLFLCVRLHSALRSLYKNVSRYGRHLLKRHVGVVAFGKAEIAVRSVATGYANPSSFFELTNTLLFDDASSPVASFQLICTHCGDIRSEKVRLVVGKRCVNNTRLGCKGLYRYLDWPDLYVAGGIADVVYRVKPRSAFDPGSSTVGPGAALQAIGAGSEPSAATPPGSTVELHDPRFVKRLMDGSDLPEWFLNGLPRVPTDLRHGASPFDRLDRPSLLLQCLREFSTVSSLLDLRRGSEDSAWNAPRVRALLVKAEFALSSAIAPYSCNAVQLAFFRYADSLLFPKLSSRAELRWLVCRLCGKKHAAHGREPGKRCGSLVVVGQGSRRTLCTGELRQLEWRDLHCAGGPADQVFGDIRCNDPGELDASVHFLGTELPYGRTPFDVLSRSSLLRHVARLHSVCAPLRALLRKSIPGLASEAGEVLVAKLDCTDHWVRGLYSGTRKFFQLVDRLLFADSPVPIGTPWLVCSDCRHRVNPDEFLRPVARCQCSKCSPPCAGRYRPMEWSDLYAESGIADVVYGAHAHSRKCRWQSPALASEPPGLASPDTGVDGPRPADTPAGASLGGDPAPLAEPDAPAGQCDPAAGVRDGLATVAVPASDARRGTETANSVMQAPGGTTVQSPAVSLERVSMRQLRAMLRRVEREIERREMVERSAALANARAEARRIADSVGMDLIELISGIAPEYAVLRPQR